MNNIGLNPQGGNIYRIEYNDTESMDFGRQLAISRSFEEQGEIEKACNTRYQAFQQLMEVIPDSTDIELDWEHKDSRDALLIIYFSSIDHFLIGDFEMCAAMLEMLLELDPEDHLEATKRLAYSYIALGEYDGFDEIINDLSDKDPEKELLSLWSEHRRNGKLPEGELRYFRKAFPVYFKEFTASDHPVDEKYLHEIESEKPSREALARELWLQTEHLWQLFPDFIENLNSHAG